ncbi:MAG: hypothetical protein LBR95_05615 [Azoarcus sp.]|jgi:hypothetical protein|nr:hypothetical protein [Azoarcus sp.]
MPAFPSKKRLLLYLYSNQNIAGCILALLGLGIFFSGYIADGWLPIVVGLYAAGWLLMWREKSEIDISFSHDVSAEDMREYIDALILASKSRLPAKGRQYLEKIRKTVADVTPRLVDDATMPDYLVTLNNAITRDLPQTINNYLQLPEAFATLHVVDKGKTCKDLLLEQLALLDRQLARIAENIHKNDAEALIVNGRFLKEKFHPVEFMVDS